MYRLVIGNRNYSSWSFRGWLMMRASGAPFDVLCLPLDTPQFAEQIGDYSPTRRVPVLEHDGRTIWESLAIAEYLAERHPEQALWPVDSALRGEARAISAEMHAGFSALRDALPFNVRARGRRIASSAALAADIARICDIWRTCRARAPDGPWLYGAFSIADAMYAPVALRFVAYAESPDLAVLDEVARAYVATVQSAPDVVAWCAEAAKEPLVIEHDEVGRE